MSNNPRDITSPNGQYKVKFDEREMRMSHWVCCPRITDIKNDKILLDLWNTQWDGEVSFEDSGEIILSLRHYPGDITGFVVHINPQSDSFYFTGLAEQIEELPKLRRRLDQRYMECRREANKLAQSMPTPLGDKIANIGQIFMTFLMLILGFAFFIAGIWWLLSGEGGVSAGIVVIGSLGAIYVYGGDVKDLFGKD